MSLNAVSFARLLCWKMTDSKEATPEHWTTVEAEKKAKEGDSGGGKSMGSDWSMGSMGGGRMSGGQPKRASAVVLSLIASAGGETVCKLSPKKDFTLTAGSTGTILKDHIDLKPVKTKFRNGDPVKCKSLCVGTSVTIESKDGEITQVNPDDSYDVKFSDGGFMYSISRGRFEGDHEKEVVWHGTVVGR